jgi:hypothetical protein
LKLWPKIYDEKKSWEFKRGQKNIWFGQHLFPELFCQMFENLFFKGNYSVRQLNPLSPKEKATPSSPWRNPPNPFFNFQLLFSSLLLARSFKSRMQAHFKHLHFESFSMVWKTFALNKIYPLYFIVKHLRTYSLEKAFPHDTLIIFSSHHKFMGFTGSFQIHAKFVISWVCIVYIQMSCII